MNSDIATRAAWRSTDRAVQLGRAADAEAREDLILNALNLRLAELQARYRHDGPFGVDNIERPRLQAKLARIRHRRLKTLLLVEITRAVTQLHAAGIDIHPNARKDLS